MSGRKYYYYVEGDTEKELINILKSKLRCIQSGKVTKFNVVNEHFSKMHMRVLSQDCVVILVYDTDVNNAEILNENIAFLRKNSIKNIWYIPQVNDLEDELVRSCDIKSVLELTGSVSIKDYKKDFLKSKNLDIKLQKHNFDISKFWNELPKNSFSVFGNDSDKIKIK